jgi:hypothetical protein
MKRLAAALMLVVSVVGCLAPVASAKTPKHAPAQVSAPGGLGNTRADFERFYGKPAVDTFDDLAKSLHADDAEFHIKSSGVVLLVEFLVNKDNVLRSTDRAFDIAVQAPPDRPWTLIEADAVAAYLLPKDAKSLGDLAPAQTTPPQTTIIWEQQFYSSSSLAKAIPDKTWWTSDDKIGDFGVSLNLDSNGSWSSVTIGTDVN